MKLISTENINYQIKDRFFYDLSNLVREIYLDIDKGKVKNLEAIQELGHYTKLSILIKKRFGLSIETNAKLGYVTEMGIVPFCSDLIYSTLPNGLGFDREQIKNINGLTDPEIETLIDELVNMVNITRKTAKKINNQKGTIDRSKGYVTGYLADVRHFLMMNVVSLKEKFLMSPEEVAATIIHEIGHAFLGLENHHRFTTTNMVISEIVNHINKNELNKVVYLYKREFGSEDLMKESLDKSSIVTDFYGPLVSKYVKQIHSNMGSSYYDATSFERGADSFAVRLGAGKYLATALKKLNYRTDDDLVESISSINGATLPLAGFISSGLINLSGAVDLFVKYVTNSNTKAPIYDNFKDRQKRISNELTNILKDRTLPKDEVLLLLNQWETVDNLLKMSDPRYNEKLRGSILKRFFRFIKDGLSNKETGDSLDMYQKNQQRKIEDTLNNELFVKAAKLNSMEK